MSTLLSTSHIAAGERAAYWIDMICDVFVQLDCTHTAERFHGEIADRTLGPLRVSRVDSNKQLVLRSSRQIARSCEDYFLVSLQLAGHGRVLQDGRAALLGPGDFALYDSTRRYTLAFDDEFTQIVLKTPRALLTDRLARAETCTALAIKGSAGMGRVAAELLRSVAREAHTLQPHEIERMAHAVIDVFATHSASRRSSNPYRRVRIEQRSCCVSRCSSRITCATRSSRLSRWHGRTASARAT